MDRISAMLHFRSGAVKPVPDERRPSKEHSANWLSTLFFAWSFSIIRTASFRRLELNDFPFLNPDRTCERMSDRLARNIEHFRKSGSKRPLLRAMEKSVRFNVYLAFILQLAQICIDYCSVPVFYGLWKYFQDCQTADPPSFARGIIWIALICVIQALVTFCATHSQYQSDVSGAEIRTALICLTSNKSFTIDKHADTSTVDLPELADAAVTKYDPGDAGRTFALMTVEAERVGAFLSGVSTFTRCSLNFPIVAGLTAWLMGWVAAPMIICMFVFQAGGVLWLVPALKARAKANQSSNERVTELNNFFLGIRLIKYFGWESYFQTRLDRIRRREIEVTKYSITVSSLPMVLLCYGTNIAFMMAYCIYGSQQAVLLGNPAFVMSAVILAVFDRNTFALNPSANAVVTGWPALKAIERYLCTPDRAHHELAEKPSSGLAVQLSSATFSWDAQPGTPIDVEDSGAALPLSEKQTAHSSTILDSDFSMAPLHLRVAENELIAIVGPSQSGKSSLLNGLIGEMPLRNGTMALAGAPSYCPQHAFIQSATVRENILFGQPFVQAVYNQVLDVCALRPDLKLFPRGDESGLGERGINLSGGQKHRIHLARVIYQSIVDSRQVVLLDDPLSAVDSRTCSIIFNDAILDLLKDKCRILVTHQLQVLSKCDRVVYMRDGQVMADGTLDQLLKFPSFADFVDGQDEASADAERFEPAAAEPEPVSEYADDVYDEEERAAYKVPWRLYSRWLGDASSTSKFLGITLVLAIAQVVIVCMVIHLGWWQVNYWGVSNNVNMAIGLSLLGGQMLTWGPYLVMIQRYFIERSYCTTVAALGALSHAPLSFYNSQPIGRLLQRFTGDINTLDTVFPPAFWWFELIIFFTLAILGSSLIYFPLVATLLVPWVLGGWLIFTIYKAAPLETKRLSVTLSAKFLAFLHEGLNGRETITLAKHEPGFRVKLYEKLDAYNSVHFLDFGTFQWATMFNNLSFIVITFCGGLLVLRERFDREPAIITVAFTLFLVIAGLLQEFLNMGTTCQKGVNAIERMHHFSRELPQEDLRQRDGSEKVWPTSGAVTFRHVDLRYKPGLPLVLKDVNLDILGTEKLGIVGRTGAGKSTLLMAMLRLVELAQGEILIDGVDVSKDLGVVDVRHAIATIPQDPVMFVGTVRFNLDPTGSISDERLYDALKQVQLVGDMSTDNLDLDSQIEPGGENLSSGQRQLLSLARALAKDSKIIIIDEATANVDFKKDAMIQKTIREVFANCTVMTIAHRLRTVLQYDRICVMDGGSVVELGKPSELFAKTGGHFRTLCDQAGITERDF